MDGTFHERGIVGPPIGLDDFTVPGTGTYKIRNHTLYLVYKDGRRREASYMVPKSEAGKEKPEQILLHVYDLSRMAVTEAPDAAPSGQILAKGDPPLTQVMADLALAHYEWLLEAKLTSEQRAKAQAFLVEYWSSGNAAEIKNTLDTIHRKMNLDKASPFVRDTLRENDQAGLFPVWRQAKDDPLSLYLIAIYDARPKE